MSRPVRNNGPRKLPRAAAAGEVDVDLSKRAEVTVVVRSRGSMDEWAKLVEDLTSTPPQQRRYLTHTQFARAWGAAPADLAAVKKFGASYGLKTVSADSFRRCVVLSGTLKQISEAFCVEFMLVSHQHGTFRTHRGHAKVHESIHKIVECVLGLDNVPSAERHLVAPLNATIPRTAARELRKAYHFPPRLHGKGETIAIIELGGGFHRSDYTRYFKLLGIKPPKLRVKQFGGAKNDPASAKLIQAYWAGLQSGRMPRLKHRSQAAQII